MCEWISVEEELPTNEDNVLVVHRGIHEDPIRAFYAENQKCFYPLDSWTSFPISVTHWMPIPKLSSSEEKDWEVEWKEDTTSS